MNKTLKTIAAIMMMALAVIAAGCGSKSSIKDTKNAEVENTNVENEAVADPGEVKNVAEGDDYNGHAFVNLGLPSGTLWSTVNIGAEWPEEYGDYFAWGEISTKNYFDWSTYDYSTGNNHYLTKYCTVSSYGRFDNKVYLEVCDDAATEIWGEGWCIPTKAQWEELRRYTSRTITYEHGVQGMRFTRYGESIFLPFAGCYWEDELMDKGDDGYYWSNQIERDSPDCAWYFELPLEGRRGAGYRSYGQSIRPVWNPY